MNKRIIRIFPDYCSSGIWTEEANTEFSELGITDYSLEMSLKYWHWTWEFVICRGVLSENGICMWIQDGQKLVDLLNRLYGDAFEFVYKVSRADVVVDDFNYGTNEIIVPLEPTEEMIQAACLNQCESKEFKTYDEWWNSHTTGISDKIRKYVVEDYKAMINAYKESFK